MKTGITSIYIDRYGSEEGAARMKSHGYDSLDYSGLIEDNSALRLMTEQDRTDALLDLKAKVEAAGLTVGQAHGPWRFPPRDGTDADRAERFVAMSWAIECAGILGCPNLVVHPIMPWGVDGEGDPEETYRINLSYFRALAKVGEEHNVTVCIENMPFPAFCLSTPLQVLRLVKEIGHPNIGMCLDTGHAVICGEDPADAVRLIGKEHLRALHVNDNDGKEDAHLIPYFGVIDWKRFSEALKRIGFSGTVSLECSVLNRLSDEVCPLIEPAIADIAAKIAGKSTGTPAVRNIGKGKKK